MADFKEELLRLYDKLVLTAELGDGMLKERLLEGLEDILSQVKIPSEARTEHLPIIYSQIDYEAMTRLSSRAKTDKVRAFFNLNGIHTYNDLLKKYHAHKNGGHMTFEDFLTRNRGIGKGCFQAINSLLQSVGIEPDDDS